MLMLKPAHHDSQNDAANAVPMQPTCEESDKCVSRCAAYGHICPASARSAGQAVNKKIQSILSDSKVFEVQPIFRSVDGSDILMGESLGEGGFSHVDACCFKDAPLNEACAIKYLKRQVMVEEKSFQHGAADLANEAFFLARLDHPNIIKLHAVTAGSVESNVASGKEAGFFIVVDRLVESLEGRAARWKRKVEEVPTGVFYRLSREYRETQRQLLKERLEVALELSKVMEYLHSLGIVFRDLKPDNVGFDRRGKLKLFDFGLAREEKSNEKVGDAQYKMTGHTGSRRYMAPEVAKDMPYDRSVDVYSFGILLWEICSLEKPFYGFSSKRHMRDIVIGGDRPKMDSSHTAHWPVELQWLMKSCWSDDAETRPSFSVVTKTLEEVVAGLGRKKLERARAVSHESHHHNKESSPEKKKHRHWHLGLMRSGMH